MDPTGGRDSRYNLNYSLGMMAESPDSIYGNPNVTLARPPSSGNMNALIGRGGGVLQANTSPSPVGLCGSGGGGLNRGIKRTNSDCYDDRGLAPGQTTLTGLDNCGSNSVMGDGMDDGYTSLQTAHNNHGQHHNNNSQGGHGAQQPGQNSTQPNKKSPPSNGKKTKGRVKIKMEYIDNKLRRYTTFSKRKTGIMKKAYELSTLTGTQVMLLVASETGHVYTFATRKLQPMITSEAGKALIQTCLNSPDPPTGAATGDQRMSATGFEETELSYNIGDEDSKDGRSPISSGAESDDSSGPDSPSVHHHPHHQSARGESMIESNGLLGLIGGSTADHHQQQSSNGSNAANEARTVNKPSSSSAAALKFAGLGSSTSGGGGGGGTSMNSVLYPALQNLPPDVLLNLVQTGHLQLQCNEDGGQFIGIPITTLPSSTTEPKERDLSVGNSSRSNEKSTGPPSGIRIKKESSE